MIIKKNMTILARFLPAVFSGLLLTLCFPKAQAWPLAFFALVPLLVNLNKQPAKTSFFIGFIFGFIHFFTLIYWIVPTLCQYGGLHPAIAVFALVLLCCYLAIYPAVFCFFLNKNFFHPMISPLFSACLWIGLEYIRTYAFTGFSWGALGYSQFTNLSFIQIADVAGVYGISFVIVLVNAVLANVWNARKSHPIRHTKTQIIYTLIIVSGVFFYGHQKIQAVDSQIASAPRTTIGVIQGNIEQDVKWSHSFKKKTVEKYARLSQTLSEDRPDLIIWPETALPFYYGLDKPLSFRVDHCIRSLDTHFLIGSPAYNSSDKTVSYYNRAYMFSPDTAISGVHDKSHLVPFGEYVPFGKYLIFLGKIIAQAGDFSAGPSVFYPLKFKNQKTGVLICFEILFPTISSEFVKNGATFLTTLTNDAWFGHTSAVKQHFTIAIFRAIENRRVLIRAANTRISGFIDPAGRVLNTTSLFTDAAITRDLPAMTTLSFYTRYPDLFTHLAMGLAMVAFCLTFVLKRVKQSARR